ncbi:hypothetical protein [Candidatus Reidiella endopervernicosa]|uniref:Uncharacterized protein n=1 Tax=Candidatus Reidiella endopervernicosa TaxID=2738883 RepID=A0A6N0HZT3_9GAMM|nr:hypothetical protein [Candidatus Reidiella endopervernicosa]QKQ27855.1 hypothetical protein HUE57_17380 [Candidatus Reidiella endopervernicosa]
MRQRSRHQFCFRGQGPGVAIFAKVCFGHPSPSKQQNFTRPFMPAAPRPSCVRCVITSSRLYTTPSVTLRRHKAVCCIFSVVRSRSQLRIYRRRRLSGTNRPHFALHGGQRAMASTSTAALTTRGRDLCR